MASAVARYIQERITGSSVTQGVKRPGKVNRPTRSCCGRFAWLRRCASSLCRFESSWKPAAKFQRWENGECSRCQKSITKSGFVMVKATQLLQHGHMGKQREQCRTCEWIKDCKHHAKLCWNKIRQNEMKGVAAVLWQRLDAEIWPEVTSVIEESSYVSQFTVRNLGEDPVECSN